MSEMPLSPEQEPQIEPGQQSMTAGAMLRQLRESGGVDVAMLASALKVSKSKVLALESDRYDELPDLVFARGLAASICRAFGVDAEPVLALMPAATSKDLNPLKNALNTPVKRSGKGASAGWVKSVPRSLLVLVGLLLLGSAVLWLWPTLPIQLSGDQSTVQEPESGAVLPPTDWVPGLQSAQPRQAEPEPEAAPENKAAPVATTPAANVPSVLPSAPQPGEPSDRFGGPSEAGAAPVDQPPSVPGQATVAPSAATTTTPMANAEAAVADAAAARAEASNPPETASAEADANDEASADDQGIGLEASSVMLALKAQAESWVSVQDAEGKSLLNRTLNPGDQVSVEGTLPLSVVIGRKDAVSVSVRGQTFDHLNLSRSSVARFQVE